MAADEVTIVDPNEYPRGPDLVSKEKLGDLNKKFFYTTSSMKRVDGRYKCFNCSYGCLCLTDLIRHISTNHPRFVPKSRYRSKRLKRQWHDSMYVEARSETRYDPYPIEDDIFSTTDVQEQAEDQSYQAEGSSRISSETLEQSGPSLKLIGKIRELNSLCPLLDPKPENSNFSNGPRVSELLKQLENEKKRTRTLEGLFAENENEFENLKSQLAEARVQWQLESKKAKEREEEWARKLADSQAELQKCQREIEFKKQQEKVEREQRVGNSKLRKTQKLQERILVIAGMSKEQSDGRPPLMQHPIDQDMDSLPMTTHIKDQTIPKRNAYSRFSGVDFTNRGEYFNTLTAHMDLQTGVQDNPLIELAECSEIDFETLNEETFPVPSSTDSEMIDASSEIQVIVEAEERSNGFSPDQHPIDDDPTSSTTPLPMDAQICSLKKSGERLLDLTDCRGMNDSIMDEESMSVMSQDLVEMPVPESNNDTMDPEIARKPLPGPLLLVHTLPKECEMETFSIASLKTLCDKEIAKLIEEMRERNDVLPLLDPKHANIHSSKDERVSELLSQLEEERKRMQTLESRLAEKEKELENLTAASDEKESDLTGKLVYEKGKTTVLENHLTCRVIVFTKFIAKLAEMQKQWECQMEKAREREGSFAKKLFNAENALQRCRKVIVLREQEDKLRNEQDADNQRYTDAQRKAEAVLKNLEDKTRSKKERFREMEKVRAELSLLH